MAVTKKDLVEAASSRLAIVCDTGKEPSKELLNVVVSAVLNEICHALVRNERVTLPNVFSLVPKIRKARSGKDPSGNTYEVPETIGVTFRPGASLKQCLRTETHVGTQHRFC